jgi:hypothetical protein
MVDDIFSKLYPVNVSDDEAIESSTDMNMTPVAAIMDSNRSAFPKDTPLAMAYVPFQKFGEIYEPEVAFNMGTLYKELNKPFLGSAGVMK